MDTSLNERFSKVRKVLNMTQEKFGNELGLNKSSISNIEKNVRSVTDKHIKLLCSIFEVNEEWIRTGEGEMFISYDEDEELMFLTAQAAKTENKALRRAILELRKLSNDELIFISELIKKLKG